MISDTAGRSFHLRTAALLTVLWASMQGWFPSCALKLPLTALCHADGSAAGPLQVLRVHRLGPSVTHRPAFAGMLRHLVLPDVQPETADGLPVAVSCLTALEVHTSPQACMLFRTAFVCINANAEAHA